jgi:hypothetical protein
MNEGHDIYIGPDDNLTDVRKRLEQVPTLTRNVTLIFDRQTQLRNPTDWKNLHAYARNQGKDVLIISPDPRTRAMAKDAKFRVVDALDSSSSSRSQSGGSRTMRKGQSSKGRPAATNAPRGASNRGIIGAAGAAAASGRITDLTSLSQRSQEEQPFTPPRAESSTSPQIEEISPTGPASSFGGRQSNYSSPPYDEPYPYPVESDPRIRPLSPQHLEEEPDMLLEDFSHTEQLRHPGQEPDSVPESPRKSKPLIEQSALERPVESIRPFSSSEDDPFAYLDDPAPSPLAEQRGSVFMENPNTSEHVFGDIAEMPTDAHIVDVTDKIEYEKEPGGLSGVMEAAPPAHSWTFSNDDVPSEAAPPPRVHGVRPRSSRSGKILPPDEAESALPIEDRPTQIIPPPSTPRPAEPPPPLAPAARAGTSPAKPMPNTPMPGAGGRTAQQAAATSGTTGKAPALVRPKARPASSGSQSKRPAAGGRPAGSGARVASGRSGSSAAAGARRARPTRQETRANATLVGIAVLALLLLGLLAFLVPSANVTLTLTSHDFSDNNLKVLAQPGGSANVLGRMPATLLSQTFPIGSDTVSGTGTATGNSPTGTAKASGIVTFTNNGKVAITLPQGTVVATASGVQFVTTADAVANITGSNTGNIVLVPVEAAQAGEVGNVPAGGINTIPTSSLSVIAQANNVPVGSLQLSVTNASALTGGGTGNTPSVTQNDLAKEEQALQAQVQPAINAWLQQHTHKGDVPGTPVITPQIVDAPTVGQSEESGTFKMSMRFVVQMLLARNSALQQAARALLNDAVQKSTLYKDKGYTIADNAQYPLQLSQLKALSDGVKSLTLTFNAAGKVVPDLSVQTVQSLIAGKSRSDAQAILAGIPGVQAVNIQTGPAFVSWVPFLTNNIHVTYAPGPSTSPGASPTPVATATRGH